MEAADLKIAISALSPAATFEESEGWLHATVSVQDFPQIMQQIHETESLYFNYLFCITCIDWRTHLTMVYHLRSLKHRHELVLKCVLDNNVPEINSVSGVWKTAIFYEREIFEMFGVNFIGHPDLRLLILPDGWEGKNPMRKNFEDPVNMIKL